MGVLYLLDFPGNYAGFRQSFICPFPGFFKVKIKIFQLFMNQKVTTVFHDHLFPGGK